MDRPWPLVNAADRAVWGTLIQVSKGPTTRLLVVRSAEDSGGENRRAPVRLIDRVVGLHGVNVIPGQRGLFLVSQGDDRDPGFAQVEGTVLIGGFLSGWPDEETRALITKLTESSDREISLTEEEVRELLDSTWSPARALALDWWTNHPERLSPLGKEALDRSLSSDDPHWLRRALQAYLLHSWSLPMEGVPQLLVESSDPVLVDLLIRALETHGEPKARAELLLAWRKANPESKCRLLQAYSRLGIEEAAPWWEEALRSPEEALRNQAIRDFGISGAADPLLVYQALLSADDRSVVSLALQGLVRMKSPAAIGLLRSFRDTTPETDPLRSKVERLLRLPHRYGKSLGAPSDPRFGGR